AAFVELDRRAVAGMRADRAQRLGGAAAARGLGLRQQRDRAVHADLQHALVGRDRLVFAAVPDVRTEPADAGQYGLAVLGVGPELARQRQDGERLLERELVRRHALQERGALGLVLALGFAELDVETVRAVTQRHLLAGRRVDAQHLRLVEVGAGGRVLLGIDHGKLPRELALGIVRAADEGTEPAELQAQPAVAAGRAVARALAAPLAAP